MGTWSYTVFITSSVKCQKATAINAIRSSISCASFTDPHTKKLPMNGPMWQKQLHSTCWPENKELYICQSVTLPDTNLRRCPFKLVGHMEVSVFCKILCVSILPLMGNITSVNSHLFQNFWSNIIASHTMHAVLYNTLWSVKDIHNRFMPLSIAFSQFRNFIHTQMDHNVFLYYLNYSNRQHKKKIQYWQGQQMKCHKLV